MNSRLSNSRWAIRGRCSVGGSIELPAKKTPLAFLGWRSDARATCSRCPGLVEVGLSIVWLVRLQHRNQHVPFVRRHPDAVEPALNPDGLDE